MTFGERLKRLRNDAGLTQRELGARLGVTYGSIHQWEADQTVPRGRRTAEIAEALGVKESTLLGLNSEMPQSVPATGMIPLLGWDQIRNLGNAVLADALADQEPIDWIPGFGDYSPQSFALTVDSDSMDSPYERFTYPQGTVVIVDPTIEPRIGQRIVAVHRGTGDYTFKELAADGAARFLKPLNPQYPTIPHTDEWRILGVVVSSFRREV